MALNYNNNVITKVKYNEEEAFKVNYNNIEVLAGENILCGFIQCDSGWSAVPPPYDDDGYHHGAKAPELEETVIAYQDESYAGVPIPSYTNCRLDVDCSNKESQNSYGDIRYEIIVGFLTHNESYEEKTYKIEFTDWNQNLIFKIELNPEEYSSILMIKLHTYALSKSTHKNYRSRALLTVNSITFIKED